MIPLARISAKSVLLILCALLILSVALRYPLVDHERQQTDSYFIHMLAGSIVDDGYAKWVFNPLSWLGYYPFSYPSGVPFLLSEASMMMGLPVETTILVTNMVLASLFCLTMFMLARSFVMRPELVLLAVSLAVVGARFVDTTYWNASARGPTVVLIALVIAVLLQARPGSNPAYYLVGLFLGAGCFFCHHMAVLLVPFGGAYVMGVLQTQYLFKAHSHHKRMLVVASSTAAFAAVVAGAFFVSDFFAKLLIANLGSTWLFDLEPQSLSVLVNVIAAYTNQIGFVFLAVLVGLPFILKYERLGARTMFLVNSMVVFVPLLGNQLYVSMLLAPVVVILGITFIGGLRTRVKRPALATLLAVLLIVSSTVLPVWSTARWNSVVYSSGDTVDVGTDLYRDATYLRYDSWDGYVITNNMIIPSQMTANSGVGFLASDISLPINDEVTPEDVRENVMWSESSFPMNLYKWFQYEDPPDPDYYIKVLMVNGVVVIGETGTSAEVRGYFQEHPKLLVLVDNGWDGTYVDSFTKRDAVFLEEIESCHSISVPDDYGPWTLQSYSFYESERSTLYLVCLYPS